MTIPLTPLSPQAQQFNWLLSRFTGETAGVVEVIAVSSDGLLIALSSQLDRGAADRLAAITSAITSLANGAARCYDLGDPDKIVIELERGYLLVTAISAGAALGVLATKAANLGNIAYEIAVFANQVGGVLTPALVDELKSTVRE